MAFPVPIVVQLLVACHRCCCICHKFCGNKIEIHHIVPEAQGGPDTEENGIPLCFDCHAEVEAYYVQHPHGRRFTRSELKKHKQQWFALCRLPPWYASRGAVLSLPVEAVTVDDRIFETLRVDDRRPAQRLVGSLMQQNRPTRAEFARRVFERLRSPDEEARWEMGMVVEELVLWEPRLVPAEVLEEMSADATFTVRASAAICYYFLAAIEPASIPLDVLSKLAAEDDGYVASPARSAMLRLARARPVIIDIVAQYLDSDDVEDRNYAAKFMERIAQRDPDLLSEELIEHMRRHPDRTVQKVGRECYVKRKEAPGEPEKDYYLLMF